MGTGLRLLCILICAGLEETKNEGAGFIFYRWSRSGCALRTYPGEESCTAHRRFTRSLGDGAWRTVRGLDSYEKARRFSRRIRLPCRRAVRPTASARDSLAQAHEMCFLRVDNQQLRRDKCA